MTTLMVSAIAATCMSTAAAQYSAHGTYFHGMGSPIGGCGVPPQLAVDDAGTPLPYVALNTNSEFSNGVNCGRWVEITVKENCEGAGNTAYSICNGGSALPPPNPPSLPALPLPFARLLAQYCAAVLVRSSNRFVWYCSAPCVSVCCQDAMFELLGCLFEFCNTFKL